MLEQYLVWLWATNSRISMRRGDKAAIFSQASKERLLHLHMFVQSFCVILQKYILQQSFESGFEVKIDS